jgi:hypothetical protein
MSHTFISYAHIDSDFVELLQIKLREEGIDIWVDHSGIKAGTNWRNSIDDAIKTSMLTILVMSPESLNSHYVTYEWSFAHGLGKPIIPLMYRQTTLHPKLDILQYLDFTHRTLRPWEQLIERIKFLNV